MFSAGALGTTRLLLNLAERRRLSYVSSRLGHQVRTNSEVMRSSLSLIVRRMLLLLHYRFKIQILFLIFFFVKS